jgi:hypothetical protein
MDAVPHLKREDGEEKIVYCTGLSSSPQLQHGQTFWKPYVYLLLPSLFPSCPSLGVNEDRQRF